MCSCCRIKRLFVIGLFISFFVPRVSFSQDYYFTHINYKTLKSITLKPNDRVFFKRGDTFLGQLVAQSGSKNGWVYYGAYGQGNKPIFTTTHHQDIVDGSPKWAIFENLHLNKGTRHGFGFEDVKNIIITRCKITNIGGGRDNPKFERLGNAIEFWRGAENIIVYDNEIDNIYDAGITNQGKGSKYVQKNIVFRNNRITRAQYGYEFFQSPTAKVSGILIYQNTFDVRRPSYKVKLRKWNIQRVYQMWDTPQSVNIKFIDNKEVK